MGVDLVSELSLQVAGTALELPVKSSRAHSIGTAGVELDSVGIFRIVNQYTTSITVRLPYQLRACVSGPVVVGLFSLPPSCFSNNKFPRQIKDQRNRTFVALSVLTTATPIYRS